MLCPLMRKVFAAIPKSIFFVFIGLFSLLFIQVVFFNSSFGYSFLIQGFLMAIWACLFVGLGLGILHKKAFIFKHKYTILFIAVVFIFAVQLWVSIVTAQEVDHDYGKVYNGAVIFALEGNSSNFQIYQNYYHHFTNNTYEFLVLQFIFKILYSFGFTNFYAATMLLGHLLFTAAIIFTFLYLDSAFGTASALFSLLFYMVYLPVYFQSSIVYTDTFSIWAPPLLLYLHHKSKTAAYVRKRLFLYILIGLFLAFSTQIKATVFITFIAIAIESIVKIKWKQTALFLAASGVSFLLFTTLFQNYAYSVVLNKQQVENEAMPVTFWVMMGLTGDGAYNPTDEWVITTSVPGKKARQELNMQHIKDRLTKMGPIGYLELLHRKTSRTFGSGNGEINYLLVRQPHTPTHWIYNFISSDGKWFRLFDNLSHSCYLTFTLLAIIGAFLALRKKSTLYFASFAPYLALIGFYLFMLLWESNHRQLVNQWPIYIILAAAGLQILLLQIEGKNLFKHKNRCST